MLPQPRLWQPQGLGVKDPARQPGLLDGRGACSQTGGDSVRSTWQPGAPGHEAWPEAMRWSEPWEAEGLVGQGGPCSPLGRALDVGRSGGPRPGGRRPHRAEPASDGAAAETSKGGGSESHADGSLHQPPPSSGLLATECDWEKGLGKLHPP